jgi:hypothetical protein
MKRPDVNASRMLASTWVDSGSRRGGFMSCANAAFDMGMSREPDSVSAIARRFALRTGAMKLNFYRMASLSDDAVLPCYFVW